MEGKNLDEAITKFEESARIDPHFKTFELLGECYFNKGEYGRAIIFLSDAAGLGNKPSRAYFLLAKALLQFNDVEKARDKLNHALSINPEYKEASDLLSSIADG